MKYRKLRIAWSVVWGIAAVLLVALWVRSYGRFDTLHFTVGSKSLGGSSVYGYTILDSNSGGGYPNGFNASPATNISSRNLPKPYLSFRFENNPTGSTFAFSTWYLVIIAIGIAIAAWLPRVATRFTLRTLLVATTLVAVGLGLIVWLR